MSNKEELVKKYAKAGNVKKLLDILHAEKDWMVSFDAAEALAKMGIDEGRNYLVGALQDLDKEKREIAKEILDGLESQRRSQALNQMQVNARNGTKALPLQKDNQENSLRIWINLLIGEKRNWLLLLGVAFFLASIIVILIIIPPPPSGLIVSIYNSQESKQADEQDIHNRLALIANWINYKNCKFGCSPIGDWWIKDERYTRFARYEIQLTPLIRSSLACEYSIVVFDTSGTTKYYINLELNVAIVDLTTRKVVAEHYFTNANFLRSCPSTTDSLKSDLVTSYFNNADIDEVTPWIESELQKLPGRAPNSWLQFREYIDKHPTATFFLFPIFVIAIYRMIVFLPKIIKFLKSTNSLTSKD